jgi:ribosomal-protein-alanine N-acetyltransferase
MEQVRTERLVGSRPLLRDADELHPLIPWAVAPSQTRTLLVRDADHWKRHRFGVWILRDPDTAAMVGRAGLYRLDEHEVELQWLLAPDRWGQGLATEFARMCVDLAFGPLGLPELTAKTLPDNTRSLAVMERLGMEYLDEVEHAGRPHLRYRLRAE